MPRSAKVNVLPSPGPCTGRIRDLPGKGATACGLLGGHR
jgi:hypothetical protein